jgi:predicted anti-sigma-YlaC factor YlaD
MTCDEIRDLMPDLAAGLSAATPDLSAHLQTCAGCAEMLEEFRQTMTLLDEWKAPEPSPYFDLRLQAHLREEMERAHSGWMHWFRRPVLAAALTVLLGVGVGMFFTGNGSRSHGGGDNQVATMDIQSAMTEPGTAVGDLQALDRNHELYSDFELLDDLEVQHDVVANP